MQKKIRKSFIILFSAIIALLLLECAFKFTPKITAHTDAEHNEYLIDLYWEFNEDSGVLILSAYQSNAATEEQEGNT